MSQGDLGLSFIRAPACFVGRTTHGKSTGLHPDHFEIHGGVEVNEEVIGLRGFVDIRQRHREITFHRGIEFVFGLYPDGIGRCIGFVIEDHRGLQRSVRFQRKERVVSIPDFADQTVSQGRPCIRIGRIEGTH